VSVDGETVTTDLRAIDQSMLVAGSMRPKTANNTATAAVFKVLKWDNNTFTRIAEEWEVSETFAALKTAFITESASIPYGSTSGTDTYTVTASPALTEYIAGATVRFKVGNQNTGASTLNVNGLGAKSLVKGVSTALAAANLLAGGVYTAVYDGSRGDYTVTTNPDGSISVTDNRAGNPNGTEAEVADALTNATPDQLARLKEVDATFKTRMKELDIDLERIAAGDRSDARDREMKTGDWTPKILAFGITLGFFGILVWMFLHGMPTSGTEAMLIMLGALQTSYTGVIAYYFGSSAGSKAKNDMLANQNGKH
jgi:hypothetical protein